MSACTPGVTCWLSGAGPSGLAATLRAAGAGANVILCEQQSVLGGSLVGCEDQIDGVAAADWAAEQFEQLENLQNVRILPRTTVQAYYDDNIMLAIEKVADHKPAPEDFEPRQRAWTITAKAIVMATGALERPMVFSGNDRPGVMLADAARRYAVEFGRVAR